MASSPGDGSVRARVREFILFEFLWGEDPARLSDADPLISTGILDSIATIKLLSYLEATWGISVPAHEVEIAEIDTVDRIVRLVEQQLE